MKPVAFRDIRVAQNSVRIPLGAASGKNGKRDALTLKVAGTSMKTVSMFTL